MIEKSEERFQPGEFSIRVRISVAADGSTKFLWSVGLLVP